MMPSARWHGTSERSGGQRRTSKRDRREADALLAEKASVPYRRCGSLPGSLGSGVSVSLAGSVRSRNASSVAVNAAGLSRLLACPAAGITAYSASGSRCAPRPGAEGNVAEVVELTVDQQGGYR